MTYHYSATGERIQDGDLAPCSDTEIVAHCNELRRILRESRARRQHPEPRPNERQMT